MNYSLEELLVCRTQKDCLHCDKNPCYFPKKDFLELLPGRKSAQIPIVKKVDPDWLVKAIRERIVCGP